MQINTSSKMYICIHATTITTGEKKNQQTTRPPSNFALY